MKCCPIALKLLAIPASLAASATDVRYLIINLWLIRLLLHARLAVLGRPAETREFCNTKCLFTRTEHQVERQYWSVYRGRMQYTNIRQVEYVRKSPVECTNNG